MFVIVTLLRFDDDSDTSRIGSAKTPYVRGRHRDTTGIHRAVHTSGMLQGRRKHDTLILKMANGAQKPQKRQPYAVKLWNV